MNVQHLTDWMRQLPQKVRISYNYQEIKEIKMISSKYSVNENDLEKVNGGMTLPKNWKVLAKLYEKQILEQFGDLSYEEACKVICQYFPAEADQKVLFEYIKQFYPEFQEQN